MEQLEGSVENIIFQSDDRRFCVLRIKCVSTGVVTAVYRGPAPFLGETVKASGEWVKHARFGQQFSIAGYQSVKPGSAEGIERFLASGAVKGIGKAMASRIVAHFGKETLEVLGSDPSRL
ncbi:MAG: ATP-dependent RecD-like DNA helicase, partial [Acidaminococcaceae bacterium]|nr:ATP-dependent RecD-like DNA helicase [Acidaminococcaceae bacterium]